MGAYGVYGVLGAGGGGDSINHFPLALLWPLKGTRATFASGILPE